jgi:hypothetical protein
VPKIKFFTISENVNIPEPTKKTLPDWYKHLPNFLDGDTKIRITNGEGTNATIKACMPFLDTFLTGYTATLWQDLEVTYENGFSTLKWRTNPEVASTRGPSPHSPFLVPPGCDGEELAWRSPFLIETDPGYDLLLTHPLNRYDLPFTTLSGIVAGEMLGTGNFPFYLKKGFEGIIEKGTPIFQIIPIKRESWVSEKDEALLKKGQRFKQESLTKITGWYKKTFRKAPDYK